MKRGAQKCIKRQSIPPFRQRYVGLSALFVLNFRHGTKTSPLTRLRVANLCTEEFTVCPLYTTE